MYLHCYENLHNKQTAVLLKTSEIIKYLQHSEKTFFIIQIIKKHEHRKSWM